MSSEIFYTKAYIKVDDKFIPLINHGSSNCSTINFQGREVPDKHWSVICYPYEDRLIFTEEEMREIARQHEKANTNNRGGTKKSRYKAFEIGEFERWFLGGLRYAYTVEEYTHFGNTVQVIDYDTRKKTTVKTTDELLEAIRSLEGHPIGVVFANDRDVKHPRRRLTPQVLNEFEARDKYYVLKNANGYFVRLTLNYVWNVAKLNDQVRKFPSERQAKAYFKKFEHRLKCHGYQITCIQKASEV